MPPTIVTAMHFRAVHRRCHECHARPIRDYLTDVKLPLPLSKKVTSWDRNLASDPKATLLFHI